MFEPVFPRQIQSFTATAAHVCYDYVTMPRRQRKMLFHGWLSRKHVGDVPTLEFFSRQSQIFLGRTVLKFV